MSKVYRSIKVMISILLAISLSFTPGFMTSIVYAEGCTITVNPNLIINEDFAGVGVNIIPTNLMTNNVSHGYNNAYWEMDRKRILMMKPKISRVWFQNDWMESTKGTYTWTSDKMLAFYKYMDALKDAGTEVELNFGWKVGRSIQSWFSIPGVDAKVSAPLDLDAYAAACSACLNQLINVKGYTNIKYLTFYNEPNGNYDFESTGDQKAYYAEMVQRVHNRLVADGRRSLVKILGPEEVEALDWTQYMKDNKNACFDGYSFHVYGTSYENLLSTISSRTNYVSPKPVYAMNSVLQVRMKAIGCQAILIILLPVPIPALKVCLSGN